MRHRFSVTPFLVAFLMGLMSQGLSVYDIHARQLGALDVGHRSTRATASLVDAERPAASGLLTRLRSWSSTVAGDERGLIASELLVPVAGIKALKQRAADLVGAMKAIQTKLGDSSLAADSPERETLRADMSRLLTLTEANAGDLKDAERMAEFERTLSPVTDPDATAAARAAAASNIQITDRSTEDPTRGFKSHRDFMSNVLSAGRTGRVDARLKPLQVAATAGSDEHGTHSDPSAAFLLPVAYSPDLLKIQSDADPTAALTRKLPMDAPMVKINARTDKDHTSSVSGGLRVYRHSETAAAERVVLQAAATSSKAATEQLTFAAEDLMGLAYATENQISDSPGAFIALISDGFTDEFDRKLLREKLRGVGSAGEYTGVMTSPALVTVSKESGQAADTIVKENIDKMESRLWGPDSSDRVVYLANKTTLPQLMSLVQVVGVGGTPVPYMTRDAGGWRLNGRRLFFSETCRAIGDLGDIVLGNWAEYIEGLYQPLQQAESIHVRFDRNERAFKFWVRNCGKCWWSAQLTPENGATMSPFVTLAAR